MGRPLGRLKIRGDYLAVAAARTKRVMPGFVLQACLRDSGGAGVRIGFTASRKVGNAVKRNRTKRRLRALAERVISELGRPGMDYVLIGRQQTAMLTFTDLEKDLRNAMNTLKQRAPNQGRSK